MFIKDPSEARRVLTSTFSHFLLSPSSRQNSGFEWVLYISARCRQISSRLVIAIGVPINAKQETVHIPIYKYRYTQYNKILRYFIKVQARIVDLRHSKAHSERTLRRGKNIHPNIESSRIKCCLECISKTNFGGGYPKYFCLFCWLTKIIKQEITFLNLPCNYLYRSRKYVGI